MDRLYQRYADPFSFMEAYLATGCFAEWTREFVKALNDDIERRQEELLWQVWLHKYDGRQSFNEWKQTALESPAQTEKPKVAEENSTTLQRNLEIANRTLAKLRRSERR